MSFADPQSVTIGADTFSLPRVSVGNRQSVYEDATGVVTLTAASQIGKRTRRTARIDWSKVSADLFLPDTNVERSMSCYVVLDTPPVGFTSAEQLDAYKGLIGQLNASTYAVITKLIGGES